MTDIPNSKLIVSVTVLCILGIFALVLAYASKKRDWRENTWPTTTATILESELSKGPIDNAGTTVRASGFNWHFALKYKFYVGEQEYISDKIGSQNEKIMYYEANEFAPEAKIPDSIAKLQTEYPIGTSAQVHYNPSNPTDCFIIKESKNGAAAIAAIIGALFLALAAMILRFILVR